MGRALVVAAVTVGLLAEPVAAGDLPDGTRAWLEQHAIPIATLDANAPFDDLQPLKPILANARIVQLGEQSHCDGATFRAKARLIRFLHEEMGFDVLAFECGLYECATAGELLAPDRDPMDVMQAAIFAGVWHTQEVHDVFQYLCTSAGTAHPMTLAGFDPQDSGRLFGSLMDDVLAFIGTAVDLRADAQSLRYLHSVIRISGPLPDQARWDAGRQALERLHRAFREHSGDLRETHGDRPTLFCERVLDNYAVRVRLRELQCAEPGSAEGQAATKEYAQLRDEQMARNLIWLADTYYPDRKIIVWAATFHLCHDLQSVVEGGLDYRNRHPMGEFVKQHFGDQVYTIGFSAYDGVYGGQKHPPTRVPRPEAGGFEDLLHQSGRALAFVDLQDDGPFAGEFWAAPLGYRPMRARWGRIVDGLFFTDTMVPAVAVGQPYPDPGQLLAAWTSATAGEHPANQTPGAVPPAGGLLNGDCEEGQGDQPTGWACRGGDPAGRCCLWDHTVAHSGTASLCLTGAAPTGNGQAAMWSQRTRDASAGRYALSAFIKSDGLAEGASAAVCVQCRSAEDKQIGFATTQGQSAQLTGTRDWTEVRVEFDAPEGTTTFFAFAFLKGIGKVWFDDMRLERK